MPEEATTAPAETGEQRATFEPAEISPLESRLSPDQIAQLDEMNARVFGGGQEAQPPVPPAAPEPPVTPAPPTPPVPPAPPKPAAPPVVDEFTPPDDDATAPAAPETPTEEFPDRKTLFPDEAIDKLRTEKAKDDIRKLGETYENLRKTLRERTQQLEEISKKGASSESDALVEDLKRRNLELSNIVEQKALRDHPGYKQAFVEPRKLAIAQAEKALQLANVPVESLKRALGTSDEMERTAAIDELYDAISSPRLKEKLSKAVEEIESIDQKEVLFLADREGNTARMLAEQRAQEQANLKSQESFIEETLDRTFEYLGKTNPFFRKSGKPGWEKWDAGIDARRAEAKELALRNQDPRLLVGVINAGVAMPAVTKAYERVKLENVELRNRIAELEGSRPSINGDRIETEHQSGTPDPNEDLVGAGRRTINEIRSGY